MVNTREKPIKVTQVNEQFNGIWPVEEDFESLAKKNKVIADFLKQSTLKNNSKSN